MFRPALLILVCLALSGCVWTRLLDWKGQLKEFDRYIVASEDGDALLLRFTEPCIQPGDIGWLLGGETPSAVMPRDGGGIWTTWKLRRDRATSIGLELTLGSNEELADSLRVPPRVLAVIPKERLLAVARAFGSAQIDQSQRQAATTLADGNAKPISANRAKILATMGEPDAEETPEPEITRLTYRFRLLGPDGTPGATSDLILDLRAEALVALRLQTPRFSAWLRLDGG